MTLMTRWHQTRPGATLLLGVALTGLALAAAPGIAAAAEHHAPGTATGLAFDPDAHLYVRR